MRARDALSNEGTTVLMSSYFHDALCSLQTDLIISNLQMDLMSSLHGDALQMDLMSSLHGDALEMDLMSSLHGDALETGLVI